MVLLVLRFFFYYSVRRDHESRLSMHLRLALNYVGEEVEKKLSVLSTVGTWV